MIERWVVMTKLLIARSAAFTAYRMKEYIEAEIALCNQDLRALCRARGHGRIECERQPHERLQRQCTFCNGMLSSREMCCKLLNIKQNVEFDLQASQMSRHHHRQR